MDQSNVNLLVVEDNDLDAEKIERLFKQLNVVTPLLRARNGLEGLDVLRGASPYGPVNGPVVILLDINMPKMNGIEFLAELRADPDLSPAEVFVLTTSERSKDVEQVGQYDVCGYFVKPIDREQMLQLLTSMHNYWSSSDKEVPSTLMTEKDNDY